MRLSTALLYLICLSVAARHAYADTLTMTETTTATGVFTPLNGPSTNLNRATLVFTYTGDTNKTHMTATGFGNAGGTETVSIYGLGTYPVFVSPYGSFSAYIQQFPSGTYSAGIERFGGRPDGTGDFSFATQSPALADYGLQGSFGPITGTDLFSVGYFDSLPSENLIQDGSLVLDSFGPTSAVQMSVVSTTPEPSTWVLLGTGLLGMVAVARRRYAGC